MFKYLYSTKRQEKLYQILDIKPFDFTYPYCSNCYKRVTTLSQNKKWFCVSCNEQYNSVNYRYRLILEISDGQDYKTVTAFGTQLDAVFGTSANEFNNYIEELKFSLDEDFNFNKLMKNAFNYCVTGRWFAFEIKPNTTVVEKLRMPRQANEDFVPVHAFLKNEFYSKIELNFSYSLESIIDTTINETVEESEAESEKVVYSAISKLKEKNGLRADSLKSPLDKNAINLFKTSAHSTPILKRLTKRINKKK